MKSERVLSFLILGECILAVLAMAVASTLSDLRTKFRRLSDLAPTAAGQAGSRG